MKGKLIKVCLLLFTVFLVITWSTLFWISYLPFELVKVKIDAYALYGNANIFTPAFFEQMVVKLRFIAIMIFLASGLLYIGRRQAQQYVSNMLTSLLSFLRELTQYFKEAIIKEDKIHLYALFIILLIAIVIRVCYLFQPMGGDEAVSSYAYTLMPLYIGLTNYSAPNNHLFHTFLSHMAYLLLGNHPWVIRLPALFAGILLVPASYMVTRIFYNKYAALLTAGIVASSTYLIRYSIYARGYTLICLIFLLILALATYLKQSRNSAAWLLFTILSALGFYTIPIMLYPFGIVIMWLFLSIIFKDTNLCRNHLLKDLFIFSIITALLAFMLYAPVFAISGLESVIANPYVTPKSWSYFIAKFPDSLGSLWNFWNRDVPSAISFLLVIGFFISLVFHKRLSIHRIPIILAVAIWCIPVLIAHRVVPYARVWLFLLPLYIGLSSAGVSYLLRPFESKFSKYFSVSVAILAITISLWMSLSFVKPPYYSDKILDNEPITIFLKDYLQPGDRVLDTAARESPDPSLIYYFRRYDVPVKFLISDLDSSQRILVIANERIQPLEELLNKEGVSVNDYGLPKLIQRYKVVSLYELNRKER